MDIPSGRIFFSTTFKVNNSGDVMNIIGPLLFVVGIIAVSFLIYWLLESDIFRPAAEKIADTWLPENRPKVKDMFLDNAMFCKDCFLYDYWFTGGGSWSPERCPHHPNSDEVILWKQMTEVQRKKAARWHDDMWFAKFNCHYFNEDQRTLF
jgi:hypothetical protein